MKNLMTAIVAAASLVSVAANLAGVIDGTNSYSAAAYSGYKSSGNYNVAVGNSSFRSAKGDNNVALGAISMGCATGCVNSVMVGPWAGYGAQGLSGCVGIGEGSFLMSGAATNRTTVNGQFVAQGDTGRFWITPSKDETLANGCPPIYYDNGTLYLNARRIVTRDDCVRVSSPLNTNDWSTAGAESIFVSPYGNDLYPGSSPYFPKRTFASAWDALTNDTATIYLLPGKYDLPTALTGTSETATGHVATVVGVGGRDSVTVDCGGANLIGSATASAWQVFRGCSFVNAAVPSAGMGQGLRAAYQYAIFFDCAFSGQLDVRNSYWGFCCCGFDGCTFSHTVAYLTSNTPDHAYGTIFNYCDAFDSVIECAVTNGTPNAAYATFFHNVYARFTSVCRLSQGWGSTPFGNRGGWSSSTLVVDSVANTSTFNEPSTNSIFGLCATLPNGWSSAAHAVTANATNVLAAIGADRRPAVDNWRWRCYGYGSEGDRAARNTAANQIIEAIVASGAISSSGGMQLMGATIANEAELAADAAVLRSIPPTTARTVSTTDEN